MTGAAGVIESVSCGPEATLAFGVALGRVLRANDFVALSGALGAGKTQLVKGVAAGLAAPADEPVVSPTFVLVREYAGRLRLYHVDAYRLSGPEELLDLGLEEMAAEAGAVLAVEWADRVAAVIPAHACRVDLEHLSERERRIRVAWAPERVAELKAALPACR